MATPIASGPDYVGAVLVLCALAMSWGSRRVVESEAVYDDRVV